MSLAQKRRPSRMVLSPDVARNDDRNDKGGRTARRTRNSPFGGMNVTAPPSVLPRNKPSRAALQRQDRGNTTRKTTGPKGKPSNDETYHALKMQRTLSPVSYGNRSRIKDKIAEVDSFGKLGLLPLVRDAVHQQILPHMEDPTPSPVQRLAIPALLGLDEKVTRRVQAQDGSVEEYLIAAETGSGKTLAYALPILDAIKRAEADETVQDAQERQAVEQRMRDNPTYVEPPPLHGLPHRTSSRPRAIILVPSAELVTQVWSVVRKLAFTAKVRSDGISAAVAPHVIRRRVFAESGIDVLVATPHLLAAISRSEPNVLSRVRHLVVDEADSLLDRSFAPTTTDVIDRCRPSLRQLIFCSATIPRSLDSALRERFPDIVRLVTPNLHAVPRRTTLCVVDIEKQPYQGNRNLACADAIYSIGKAAAVPEPGEQVDPADLKRILVFVNEREKTVEVADYLQSKGINAAALNRDTPEQRKSEILADFTTHHFRERQSAQPPTASAPVDESEPPPSLATEPPPEEWEDPELEPEPAPTASPLRSARVRASLATTKVLVTTDLASRGIDTLAVRNVILYDVPHTTIDFIHRLGRTGRMKARGRGVVLVGKRDRRDVVREVKEGMFRGQALI